MVEVTDYTALLQATSWAGFELSNQPMFITFSFPNVSPASNGAPEVMGAAAATFQAFDNADKALARQALQAWADACGIVVLEVRPGQGDLTFAWYDFTGTAWDNGEAGLGYNPGGNWNWLSEPYFTDHREFTDLGGNMLFDLDSAVAGKPGYGLLLHEIGHALGLKHPFEEREAPHDVTLDPALDTTANTVMSYTGAEPTTLGQLDIDAVVHLYGAAGSDPVAGVDYVWDPVNYVLTRFGDGSAETLIGVSVADSITGGGGNDSLFGLDMADTLLGGSGHDGVFGGSGNDQLVGGTGDDTMEAGTGNDTLNGQDGNDVLWASEGNDRASGLAGDDWISGGDGNDRLDGGDGNDAIYGDAGADLVEGGAGDDYLVGGSENDRLYGDAGADLAWGDTGNDRLWGGADGDQLSGDDGNDQVYGEAGDDNLFGGADRDTLTGGVGADSLSGGSAADRFVFDPGFGDDIVWDFEDGLDRLAFSAIPGVTGIANLAIGANFWGDAVITVAGQGSVTVVGLAPAGITAADLLFL